MRALLTNLAAVLAAHLRDFDDRLIERLDTQLLDEHERVETPHGPYDYACPKCLTEAPCAEWFRLLEVRHEHRQERATRLREGSPS